MTAAPRPWYRLGGVTSQHLHRRIVVVFLGLLLIVQATSFLAIRHGIEANARRDVARDLKSGETLLRRLLAQNTTQLTEAARLLAADYGFRAAVASGDSATLKDALINQAERIDASVAVFTDPAGRPIASTIADPGGILAKLAADAVADPVDRGSTGLQVHEGRAYQLIVVPVKAPQLIGQVAMGFPLSAALPRDFAELSQERVVFVVRARGGAWRQAAVGSAPAAPAALVAALEHGTLGESIELAGDSTAVRVVPLAHNAEREIDAVLLRSIDEAVAPYRSLQWTLLAITLAGVLVFGIGGFVTARRITKPINALASSAERLASGDYASPVPLGGADEVGHLARSFESMRVGIRERDAEIRRLAYWDALTGLPNREQFRHLLRERLAAARRGGEPCSVLMLDIDRFKHVNNVLGHAFGDRLLGCIAARLSASLNNEGHVVAGLGGDKFAVCLPRLGVDAAADLASQLLLALQRPLALDDHTIDVSAGIGVATYPVHAGDAEMLLGRAELAMYAAKARQAGVVAYEPALDSASDASLSLLSELRSAVDGEQLRLYLQPKLSLASGDVCGAEALVRWQHPRRGLLGPNVFVPFAEQTGFIREVTGWMVEQSAARCSALRDMGLKLRVSVNLSTKDLMDLRLADKLEKTLARRGLDPSCLCLEITESAIMDDAARALLTLQRLDAMGIALSIDDFGTGYSSLAYLKTLPLHELKIDRSFVMAMEHDRADLKIVRSTVDLAHNLGYSVVAEGVETAQTWAILKALKCDQAQGYFMARPMPEDEFGRWLDQWSRPQTRLRTEFAELM